jgi:cytochrome P450
VTTTDPVAADSAVDFDPYSDVFFNDPYPTYVRMQDEAPVFHSPRYGGFYALTRYEDVAGAMKDFETFSSAYGIDLFMVNSGKDLEFKSMIMLDPPEHDRLRGLVSKVFTPRAINALEPTIRSIQEELLAATEGKDTFDVVADFSNWFPMEVISTMLGVPPEKRRWLRELLDQGLVREPGQLEMSEKNMEAMVQSGGYWYQLITEKRANPGDDMISKLIAAELDRGDGTKTALDDIEITSFVSLLGGAGAETVTKAIGSAIYMFGKHPDQWKLLVEDAKLIPQAVEEILRFLPPSHYEVRKSLKEVTLHGTTIPEGSAVMVIQGATGRDERQYPNANSFDITRTPGPMLSLGYGIHSCLGAALARLECRIALELLAKRMPRFEVVEDGLRRVNMSNVAGYSHVPVRVLD